MITDNSTENDLLAETIEELGQSLTELQQVIAYIKLHLESSRCRQLNPLRINRPPSYPCGT